MKFVLSNKKKKVVLDAAQKAKVITVATSPFFIDQMLAIKVFKDKTPNISPKKNFLRCYYSRYFKTTKSFDGKSSGKWSASPKNKEVVRLEWWIQVENRGSKNTKCISWEWNWSLERGHKLIKDAKLAADAEKCEFRKRYFT